MIGNSAPHIATVNPIVAAAGASERQKLVALAQRASFDVESIAADPASLAALLQRWPQAWVVTGGTLPGARPFLQTARAVQAPAIAIVSNAAEGRATLGYGGLAVLGDSPAGEMFIAAAAASRAGLSVWDPGLDTPTDRPEPREPPLSPRERSVLELAGAGLSTKTVARQLGISPNTVKFHLQAAFEKLGVTSRAEAVVAALRRGELTL